MHQCWFVDYDHWKQTSVIFFRKDEFFSVVCKTTTVWFRLQCFNPMAQWHYMASCVFVYIGTGNGLSLDSTEPLHYSDVITDTITPQITSFTICYSTVYSGVYQRQHQSSASLAFVWGIHRGPVNSPHKWSVTRKMFPFDDVIMTWTKIKVSLIRLLLVLSIQTFPFRKMHSKISST